MPVAADSSPNFLIVSLVVMILLVMLIAIILFCVYAYTGKFPTTTTNNSSLLSIATHKPIPTPTTDITTSTSTPQQKKNDGIDHLMEQDQEVLNLVRSAVDPTLSSTFNDKNPPNDNDVINNDDNNNRVIQVLVMNGRAVATRTQHLNPRMKKTTATLQVIPEEDGAEQPDERTFSLSRKSSSTNNDTVDSKKLIVTPDFKDTILDNINFRLQQYVGKDVLHLGDFDVVTNTLSNDEAKAILLKFNLINEENDMEQEHVEEMEKHSAENEKKETPITALDSIKSFFGIRNVPTTTAAAPTPPPFNKELHLTTAALPHKRALDDVPMNGVASGSTIKQFLRITETYLQLDDQEELQVVVRFHYLSLYPEELIPRIVAFEPNSYRNMTSTGNMTSSAKVNREPLPATGTITWIGDAVQITAGLSETIILQIQNTIPHAQEQVLKLELVYPANQTVLASKLISNKIK